MGALASNRNKRDASSQSPDYNLHIAKKLKCSSHIDSKKVSRSSVSRLSLYPQKITPITREVHAPCRFISGFLKRLFTYSSGIIRQKSIVSGDHMGNALFAKYSKYAKYNLAKESANGRCKNVVFKGDNDVVEVINVDEDESVEDDDDDEEEEEEDDSGSSSVDVVEMVEDERECRHVSVETEQIVARYRELDRKGASTSSLNHRGSDDMDVDVGLPLHKRLKNECDEKWNLSLRRLRFDIKVLETKRALLQQSRPAKKKEDVENDPFRPLTEEEGDLVANALSYSNRNKVLVTHENSNITITGEVMQCLRPYAWLNDEVINVYLELLKERENREPKKFLKCHFFNTFFYKKLVSGRSGYDYNSVRRWTTQKKLGYGLLECDKIFVPIHKEIHWCLAVINKKEEKFQYLDSLGGADTKVLRMLAQYITDEVKDKTGKNIDVTSWEQEFVTDLPNQENGYDCGMFMIKYADFYSRDIGLCFNQEHMPYFRLRTAKEILKLRAN
ncbi:putative Ulp1 peptidase [Helianthus annuus]|nr:putative Ulp1 peptidase [Helianthus annuus]